MNDISIYKNAFVFLRINTFTFNENWLDGHVFRDFNAISQFIFAVYNSLVGLAHVLDGSLKDQRNLDNW